MTLDELKQALLRSVFEWTVLFRLFVSTMRMSRSQVSFH